MKGKFDNVTQFRGKMDRVDPEHAALRVLERLAAEPERLGRFMAETGIGPDSIRASARDPGFLAAVLDHVAGDETLLVAVADELGMHPAALADAQARLSPPAGDDP